jgi:hypothetical protein
MLWLSRNGECRVMTNSVMRRLAKVFCSQNKRSVAVFKKVNGADVTLGLVAAAFFVLAYAVETKAILVLESSQDLFEVIY